MKLIFTDLKAERLTISGQHKVIENNGKMHHCIGCFGCWIKTPGKCVILDGYENLGKDMSQCTELIIVSECVYGSVSPFIKNVLDRTISYIHPNFCMRNGEMHHQRRYENRILITVYFYGQNITEAEKETARSLVRANAVNHDGEVKQIVFFDRAEEVEGLTI